MAATLVIFHHIEQYKSWAGWKNSWGNSLIDALGHMPVGFFFVLSGFLITYLLLKEKGENGNVAIKTFYWKRVIRIWPLYFLICTFALFIVPVIGPYIFPAAISPLTPSVIIPLVIFLPNLLRISFPNLIGANQLWSVGIEEQFYLFWPWVVKLFHKSIFKALLILISIKFTGQVLLEVVSANLDIQIITSVNLLYRWFPIEQMIIGGIGAIALFQGRKRIQTLLNPFVLFLMVIVWVAISNITSIKFLSTYVEGVIFLIIILWVIRPGRISNFLENAYLNYLGTISYGIYMWHTLAIVLTMTLLKIFGLESGLLLYVLSPLITLLLAHISYQNIESRFLKLRDTVPFRPFHSKLKNA